jgi:hypothetical protein
VEEKCEDTKGEVRSRKSKERQHNGQKIPKGKSEAVNQRKDNTMVKRKKTNNDLQNTTQKIKDRATRTPIKMVVNSGRVSRTFSTCNTPSCNC